MLFFKTISRIIYDCCCFGGAGARQPKEKSPFKHVVDNLEGLAQHEIDFILNKIKQKQLKYCC